MIHTSYSSSSSSSLLYTRGCFSFLSLQVLQQAVEDCLHAMHGAGPVLQQRRAARGRVAPLRPGYPRVHSFHLPHSKVCCTLTCVCYAFKECISSSTQINYLCFLGKPLSSLEEEQNQFVFTSVYLTLCKSSSFVVLCCLFFYYPNI